MRSNLRSILTFFVGWPLSFIALFFLARSFLSRTDSLQADLSHLHWPLLLAGLVCFIGYYYIRSYTWYLLLKYKEYDLDVFESLFQWSFAQLKRYIPGNIWGVVGVSVHFSKKNISKQSLASAFVTESQLVLLAGLFLTLFGIPLLVQALPIKEWEGVLRTTGTWLVILACFVYFSSKKIHSLIKLPGIMKYVLPEIGFHQLLTLWTLIVLSFVCYGLGTYLTISAVTYLDPTHLWEFIGYFIFSLIIGFLSFITPTGLGVREGTMALGLATVMTAPLAAFSALFARVILVFGEILSICIFYLLHKAQKGRFANYLDWIRTHPFEVLLTLSFAIFVVYFSFISILRYDNFYAGRFDLGNMEQTVWNTLHGQIFQFTNPNSTNVVSRLAFHADFILILLTPLYFFWQDPRMLLIIQAVIVGAGGFFIYVFAKDILKIKSLAFVFALLYFLNPSLERSVIFDFHAVTLATTFLLGAFYFIYKKKYGWFIIFAILAGITKEQIWAIIALLGLYIAFFQHQKRLGIAVTLFSIAITYFLIWYAIPQAAGSQHFALSYYANGEGSDSPTSLIKMFLFSPDRTLTLLTDSARISYLNKLFLPVGYISLLSPLYLIFAGPDLFINLLSSKAELYQIYYQYTAAITPFIFISAVFGAWYILKKVPFITHSLLIFYLIGSGLFATYLYSPLPGSQEPNLDMITKTQKDKPQLDRLLADIPPQYSVSTSNSLGSHVAHRKYLFTMPYGWDDADYIVFMLNETNAYPSLQAHRDQARKLATNPTYIKYFDDGTIIAFHKKSISMH